MQRSEDCWTEFFNDIVRMIKNDVSGTIVAQELFKDLHLLKEEND